MRVNNAIKDVSLASVFLSDLGEQATYNQALAAEIGRLVQNVSESASRNRRQRTRDSTWAANATSGIKDLLRGEQSKFEKNVNDRVKEMQKSITRILPKQAPDITRAIESATPARVDEVGRQLNATTCTKPVYDTGSLKKFRI
ncbi:hypothetical protein FRB95_005065 [Tulasnella sp. JGI-2019a]|nr:hypothetical protein FRB93_001405 [Tulasnella sp. JGI-2019a]KAG9029629.1 hypothetical protein FRB95_005065 [Tulasnella sp. JGI-2019a]